MADDELLDAGPFGAWLDVIDAALERGTETDVPCGTCTGCCTSSQFVHIGPDETDALAHIPPALLFPAPRMPTGHLLMGYDQRGHCPMLVDGRCSIYEHRPRTCRVYDCRVFPAAGLLPDEPDKEAIAATAARWRFRVETADERRELEAVRAAAAHLRTNGIEPGQPPPATTTQRAVTALRLRARFSG